MKKGMVMPRFNICIYFQVSSIEDRKKKEKKDLWMLMFLNICKCSGSNKDFFPLNRLQ